MIFVPQLHILPPPPSPLSVPNTLHSILFNFVLSIANFYVLYLRQIKGGSIFIFPIPVTFISPQIIFIPQFHILTLPFLFHFEHIAKAKTNI